MRLVLAELQLGAGVLSSVNEIMHVVQLHEIRLNVVVLVRDTRSSSEELNKVSLNWLLDVHFVQFFIDLFLLLLFRFLESKQLRREDAELLSVFEVGGRLLELCGRLTVVERYEVPNWVLLLLFSYVQHVLRLQFSRANEQVVFLQLLGPLLIVYLPAY